MQVFAGMVELADTQDLGSCAERCTGSTPATRTKQRTSTFCWGPLFYTGGRTWEGFCVKKMIR